MLNQNFPVIYNNKFYMVDPICLNNASKRFHDLIKPFINQDNNVGKMNLQINCSKFTDRNVENFLKLCQNLPADVQDSEVEGICEIAKLFQADQIYNTGINFVHSKIDPNFYVPDNEFDESNGNSYLILSAIAKKVHHVSDLGSLEFEDENSDNNCGVEQSSENVDPNCHSISHEADEKKPQQQQQPVHAVIYEIRNEPQLIKLPKIHFISEGQILLTAKHKDNTIVIGKGSTVHLNKDRSNHVCKIVNDNGVSDVNCEGQEFHISYLYFKGPGTFSIASDFINQGKVLHWRAKEPKHNKVTNSYTLSLHGEYHHFPLKSTKNTVLINDAGETCLIIRKVGENEFEAECNPSISQTIIFALALSQIIGPNATYSNMMRM